MRKALASARRVVVKVGSRLLAEKVEERVGALATEIARGKRERGKTRT